ncbi:MAG: TldD/PmbA family protein [Bacteroidales bacterium]|jgi:PmbA protein|nr:TldD/PmbA family protein [Bacteroidales bacterium]
MRDITIKALQMALDAGASGARVILEKGNGDMVTILNGEIDRLYQAASSALNFHIFAEGRYGTFSTNLMDEGTLRQFTTEAVKATLLMTPDQCRTLPDRAICYEGGGPDLQQYDPSIETRLPSRGLTIAQEVSAEMLSDNRVISAESEYADYVEEYFIADSLGFEGYQRKSGFSIGATCSVAGNGEEKPERNWYEDEVFFENLRYQGCGTKALNRAIESIGPLKLSSGTYNMVVDSTVASKLVIPLTEALKGSSLHTRNSFLADKLGKKVFGDNVCLRDMPHTVGNASSRLFNIEGIATKERDIISSGTICNYFIDNYYSRKLSLEVTIGTPSVVMMPKKELLSNKKLSLSDILKRAVRGIYVTQFNGGNCNAATGDFSYGIEGFLFNNGEIVHPVNEMLVSGNLIGLWNNLIATADDQLKSRKWQIPSLCFSKVNFNGL